MLCSQVRLQAYRPLETLYSVGKALESQPVSVVWCVCVCRQCVHHEREKVAHCMHRMLVFNVHTPQHMYGEHWA